jgi:hypothetical protein
MSLFKRKSCKPVTFGSVNAPLVSPKLPFTQGDRGSGEFPAERLVLEDVVNEASPQAPNDRGISAGEILTNSKNRELTSFSAALGS